MTLKVLLNAVVDALRAGTGTHLDDSATRVFKGDLPAWSAAKAVFVMPDSGQENPVAVGDDFDDQYILFVDVRMPIRDEAATVVEGDWYDDYLELCEEVKVVLTTVANRRIIGADSSIASKMALEGYEFGMAEFGDKQCHMCRYVLRYFVPQA